MMLIFLKNCQCVCHVLTVGMWFRHSYQLNFYYFFQVVILNTKNYGSIKVIAKLSANFLLLFYFNLFLMVYVLLFCLKLCPKFEPIISDELFRIFPICK